MKSPNRKTVSKLTDLPNIGKAMARDLNIVGIQTPKDLIGKDGYQLYDELCMSVITISDVIDPFFDHEMRWKGTFFHQRA